MELANIINVIAVSSNQEDSTSLLNSCFVDLQTSDNQEWTKTVGDYTIRGYIKHPGSCIHRRAPQNHIDFLLASVSEGHEKESEVLSYARSRLDCPNRLIVGRSADGLTQVSATDVLGLVIGHSEKVGKFNEEFKKVAEDGIVWGSDKTTALIQECTGFESNYCHCITYAVTKYVSDKQDYKVSYNHLRKLVGLGQENLSTLKVCMNVNKELSGLINKTALLLESFANFDTSRLVSTNKVKVEFCPNSGESDGIGATIQLVCGEDFLIENSNLPLAVRENPATISLEIHAKDTSGVDSILATLEQVKGMAEQMGVLGEIKKNVGGDISFSKEGSSVFIDLTLGEQLGEDLINRIREFNLEKFKLNINDLFRFQTGLNVKDIYENFNADNVLEKLSNLTILSDANILNIRAIMHLIRENVKFMKSEKNSKALILASYGLLMLSTFETFNVSLKYDQKELKKNIINLADTMNGGEGFYAGMCEMANGVFPTQVLPMVLETIESVKPMLGMFGDGLSFIDFDKLSVELLVPSVRFSLKGSVLLPGLTEFVEKNVLN